MNIVLTDICGASGSRAPLAPSLGLLYLASYLQERFPGLRIAYISQRQGMDRLVRALRESRPALLGISINSHGAPQVYAMTRVLKDRFPRLPIVCGGAHAAAAPEDVLAKGRFDACVTGEGERTMAELVRRADDLPAALPAIDGLAFVAGGAFRATAPARPIEDLDAIPFPARDLAPPRDFVGMPLARNRPYAEMLVSRGCRYRCLFCSNPVFRGPGPRVRMRSPENIKAEAGLLYERGYREIFLCADELNADPEWALRVCAALASLGRRDLFFQCHLRGQAVSAELARALRDMNCWAVRIGIESASERVLAGIKKGITTAEIEKTCSVCAEAGLRVYGYFMMFQAWEEGGALCVETPEEVAATIAFAEALASRKVLHYASWAVATPRHGSGLHAVALRHGLCDNDYYPCDGWDPVERLPGVTRRSFSRLYRKALSLQARLALRNGAIQLRNWRSLLRKGAGLVRGR